MQVQKTLAILFLSVLGLCTFAETLYVNNISGNDKNDGLSEKTAFASIEKAFASVKTSDHVEIANTGKPYQRPYPGERGQELVPRCGGTADAPLVVNGNGAVISGLSVIPAEKWKKESEKMYTVFFYPMSNMYKGVKKDNFWFDETQIWWVDGEAAPNCKSMEALEKVPGAFWWNKAEKKLVFHLPQGKKIGDLKIEIPSNSGIYITHDHALVKNFVMIFSWNDGFDIAGSPKNVVYKNCSAYNNCGQGFSCHNSGNAYYEDCAAIRCASSGACDVHWCNSTYKRCIFVNNTYEAGVYATDESVHNYDDCLIAGNRPFEQIWQRSHSKMNFANCVIVGRADSLAISSLANGSVSFKNCTITDAASVCAVPSSSTASLAIESCVLARCREFFIKLPGVFKDRFYLKGNLYIGGPGNIIDEKLYGPENWAEYLKLGLEMYSEWRNIELTGPLKAELPEAVMLKGRHIETSVGAKLPEEVWKRYFKLLKDVPTPAGIIEEK
ncbi:MAG: right-handed parallel beta-helix repeat-containing protein [Candidatus Izemoplasmatales bacterium]|nr:right-handed parallel beta-helix repeat-containing protein [Candidatus Izemoplasmatales bacterium]